MGSTRHAQTADQRFTMVHLKCAVRLIQNPTKSMVIRLFCLFGRYYLCNMYRLSHFQKRHPKELEGFNSWHSSQLMRTMTWHTWPICPLSQEIQNACPVPISKRSWGTSNRKSSFPLVLYSNTTGKSSIYFNSFSIFFPEISKGISQLAKLEDWWVGSFSHWAGSAPPSPASFMLRKAVVVLSQELRVGADGLVVRRFALQVAGSRFLPRAELFCSQS